MFYIVGLGNQGRKYEKTRHNVGFLALDYLVTRFNLPTPNKSSRYAGRISAGVIAGTDVTLLYPDTQMNHSGTAVKKLLADDKDGVSRLIVIYDDADLSLGSLKLSFARGAGGHKGLKSVIDSLGTKDFKRIRIGIAGRSFFSRDTRRPKGAAITRHVLGVLTAREETALKPVFKTVSEAVLTTLESGFEVATNQFNR